MHLVVVHKSPDCSLLNFAFSCKTVANIVISRMFAEYDLRKMDYLFALPSIWKSQSDVIDSHIIFYDDKIPVLSELFSKNSSIVISNGNFLIDTDKQLLYEAVSKLDSDIVAVEIKPFLRARSEQVLLDSQLNLLGFRLFYTNAVHPAPIPCDWPHLLFIKSHAARIVLENEGLPLSFEQFLKNSTSKSITMGSIYVGGRVMDLNSENGLLSLISMRLENNMPHPNSGTMNVKTHSNLRIADSARFYGEVILGQAGTINNDVIIAGPAVIGDNCRISDKAVIRRSIIGSGIEVPSGACIQNRVITHFSQMSQQVEKYKRYIPQDEKICYRSWQPFSYARCLKRTVDIILSALVLIVFAPVAPFIALAIKLSSKGPIFYKAIRQGLHGKNFPCLKFRTMHVGAEGMQEKLRVLNEADGPQFVISDDPRMSKVGRFLRETYIDEIPQFLSVLFGHMSVVGPRPSPESENIQCPFWRDARLSVRPGITGLWQVCRTRKQNKDFQEWIHYDIEYVRNLSIKLDLKICWMTAKKMFVNFIRQF